MNILYPFLSVVVISAFLAGPALSEEAPKRVITKIAGDLYRFQNNFHYSVFLVTPEGVIATDPINAEAATWLKAEIKKRFDDAGITPVHENCMNYGGMGPGWTSYR